MNQRLLDWTFLSGDQQDEDDFLEGPPIARRRRSEACEFLLQIDNGAWSNDAIVHWCTLGCCKSSQESKLKLWVAIQARAWAGLA